MTFEWSGLIGLARQLERMAEGASGAEAFRRTALNRAYFGAFGFARECARKWLSFRPAGTDDDHRSLRQHFWRNRRQNVARFLDQLRKLRNSADYENDLPYDPGAAVAQALHEADRLLAALSPPKPQTS